MRNKSGFTLIEILIALFIFVLLSLMVTSALRTVLNAHTATDKNAHRFAELQMAVIFLSQDLEQVINRPISNANGGLDAAFTGDSNTVNFTRAGAVNPEGKLLRSTLQRVHYQLEKGTLVRTTWAQLDRTRETPFSQRNLLQNVDSLELNYLDEKNTLSTRWPPPSHPATVPPRAVRVILKLHDLGKISQLYILPGQVSDTPP